MRHTEIASCKISDQIAFCPRRKAEQEAGGHGKRGSDLSAEQYIAGYRGQAEERKGNDALPKPIQQQAGDDPARKNAQTQNHHNTAGGFSINAAIAQHFGKIDKSAAKGRCDNRDG